VIELRAGQSRLGANAIVGVSMAVVIFSTALGWGRVTAKSSRPSRNMPPG
jgi:hypothetical protein